MASGVLKDFEIHSTLKELLHNIDIMKKTFIPGIVIIFSVLPLMGQYLSNPSFEGEPGISTSPPGWIPFDEQSTPDTEPVGCYNFTASDGSTYLTLVSRGPDSQFPNTFESCYSQLSQPLLSNYCYSLEVDLASRDDVGHYEQGFIFISYLADAYLKIYGTNDLSDRGELLGASEKITNQYWKTSVITFSPGTDVNYIILEIGLSDISNSLGNLLIDNIRLKASELKSNIILEETYESSDLPVTLNASASTSYSWSPNTGLSCYNCQSPDVIEAISRTYTCTLMDTIGCPFEEIFILNFIDESPVDFKIPNVFTPNGDGINDLFEIPGLPPYSTLQVFDRSGKLVKQYENYNNNWDGSDMDGNELVDGTYWYILTTPGLSGKHKGYVYIKKE